MTILRSGKHILGRNDFLPRFIKDKQEPEEGTDIYVYPMRIRPYTAVSLSPDGANRRTLMKARYVAIVGSIAGFIGEGASPTKAANQACLKLKDYMEYEIECGRQPMSSMTQRLDTCCNNGDGMLFVEKVSDSSGSWSGPAIGTYKIETHLINGKVSTIIWFEDGSETCFQWKEATV